LAFFSLTFSDEDDATPDAWCFRYNGIHGLRQNFLWKVGQRRKRTFKDGWITWGRFDWKELDLPIR
jgi:hypothetical protein